MNVQTAVLILVATFALASRGQANAPNGSVTNPSNGASTTTPNASTTTNAAVTNQSLILDVQRNLQSQGYGVTSSGQFDTQTVSAIKAYQAKNGLPQSGSMDTATLNALKVQQ